VDQKDRGRKTAKECDRVREGAREREIERLRESKKSRVEGRVEDQS